MVKIQFTVVVLVNVLLNTNDLAQLLLIGINALANSLYFRGVIGQLRMD